jgi:type I restriction enzyme S subunit
MSSEKQRPLIRPLFAPSVKPDWSWHRLDDVSEVYDCPHSTPELVEDTSAPFVVRSQDMRSGTFLTVNAARVSLETYQERIRRIEPRFGDLVYSREGTYFGIAAAVPRGVKVCLGQRMVLIRPDPARVHHAFLRYWLNSPQIFSHIHGFRDGTVAERLNLPVIRGLAVAFPSLTEQVAIADVLSSLDDRIALLRETNATLEAIAQALFKSWFVDFDPVRARQQGLAPKGMDEATAALFPDGFEESEMGLVPKGWRWMALEEAYWINPPRKLKKGEPAPYIDMSSVPTQGHSPEAPTLREHGSGSKFQNGDALLARITPCLENGKSAFVDCLDDGKIAWGSTEFIVLKPKPPLPDYHAYLLCRHPAFREYAIQSMSGTSGRQRVQNDVLGRFMITVPDTTVTEAFGSQVLAIQQKIACNHHQAQTLATLRDTLLPRLISGQLRLPEVGDEN